LQNPSQINIDYLNDIRHETSRIFSNKKGEYLNNKISFLETNNKSKRIRDLCGGINEFKKGYQPRTNMVKGKNCNLIADSDSILSTWKNYFISLLIVYGVG
jgi:hypothetical protein